MLVEEPLGQEDKGVPHVRVTVCCSMGGVSCGGSGNDDDDY